MAAWFYDALLAGSLSLVAMFILTVISVVLNIQLSDRQLQFVFPVSLGVYFVYFWTHGGTLAMKTWKLSLTDSQGKPLQYRAAMLRYVLCWIWIAPPLAVMLMFDIRVENAAAWIALWIPAYSLTALFRADQQFLHDALAGTKISRTTE